MDYLVVEVTEIERFNPFRSPTTALSEPGTTYWSEERERSAFIRRAVIGGARRLAGGVPAHREVAD